MKILLALIIATIIFVAAVLFTTQYQDTAELQSDSVQELSPVIEVLNDSEQSELEVAVSTSDTVVVPTEVPVVTAPQALPPVSAVATPSTPPVVEKPNTAPVTLPPTTPSLQAEPTEPEDEGLIDLRNMTIQQSLGTFRGQAELSYNENAFSYVNVCSGPRGINLLYAVQRLATGNTTGLVINGTPDAKNAACLAGADWYVVQAPQELTTETTSPFWCVDSTTFKGFVSKPLAAGSQKCQP